MKNFLVIILIKPLESAAEGCLTNVVAFLLLVAILGALVVKGYNHVSGQDTRDRQAEVQREADYDRQQAFRIKNDPLWGLDVEEFGWRDYKKIDPSWNSGPNLLVNGVKFNNNAPGSAAYDHKDMGFVLMKVGSRHVKTVDEAIRELKSHTGYSLTVTTAAYDVPGKKVVKVTTLHRYAGWKPIKKTP